MVEKKLTGSVDAKRALVEPDHPELSIRRQCALLGLSRASYAYEAAREDSLNLELMRCIDRQYLETPVMVGPR